MKRVFVIALVLLCTISLLGFAGGQQEAVEGEEAQEEAKVYTFKYAHTQSGEHPRSESMEYFKEQLEKLSDGRIEVELFFGGTMGNEAEVVDMVKTGNIQGMRGGSWQKANPKYFIYALPFMFEDPYQAGRAMDSEIGDQINAGALDNGLYVPACGVAGGARQITNNVRPIKSIEDLKGLKIRTPPIGVIVRSFKAFGANPQEVPYTETYMALKTGVVDGQENPIETIYAAGFHEIQDYLIITNHINKPAFVSMNADFFNGLSEEHQDIILNAAEEGRLYARELMLKQMDELEEKMVESGMEVIRPDLEPFKEATQSVRDELGTQVWGEEVYNQIKEIGSN